MDILSAAVAMDVAIAVGAAAHMCVYENPAWPGVTWRTLARRRVEGPQAVLSARPSRSSRRREFACCLLNIKKLKLVYVTTNTIFPLFFLLLCFSAPITGLRMRAWPCPCLALPPTLHSCLHGPSENSWPWRRALCVDSGRATPFP